MANRLQLKRGTTTPGSIFYEGEPIYDKSAKVLYVGDNGGAGSGAGSAVASADSYASVLEMLYKTSAADSGSIRLYEDTDNGTNYVAIAASAVIGSNFTLRLPDSAGSDGQVLKTDGTGNLAWVNQTSGFSGFTISDGSNTSTITDTNTITFSGGTGITAAVTQDGDAVTYSLDAELQALSSVTSAADALPYFTGSGTASVTTLSSFGRSLIDDADAAAARTTLGVDAAGTDNSTNVTLVTTTADYLSIAGQAITLGQIDLTTDVTGALPLANGGTNATTASGARTNLGLAIGTDVQAHGAILDDLSGLTQAANKLPYFDSSTTAATTDLSSFGRSLIDDADAAAARTTLGVDAAGTDNSTDVTLAGSYDYLTISGQAITLGQIDLTTDVTGSLPNGNLANSTITVTDGTTSTATALGGTITFAGTANEVTVAESSGTITVGLPDDVTIAGSLTVTQNLNVLGTAVTFSVETTRVEDRVLELGLVNGAAPTATTTWDSALAFNYFQTSAKKSGVVWLNNQFMAMLSELSESADTGNADPQITATAYAPVATGGLYIGGIAAENEVINSLQAAVNLTFDGGTY
jgi:hypothetical protein